MNKLKHFISLNFLRIIALPLDTRYPAIILDSKELYKPPNKCLL